MGIFFVYKKWGFWTVLECLHKDIRIISCLNIVRYKKPCLSGQCTSQQRPTDLAVFVSVDWCLVVHGDVCGVSGVV